MQKTPQILTRGTKTILGMTSVPYYNIKGIIQKIQKIGGEKIEDNIILTYSENWNTTIHLEYIIAPLHIRLEYDEIIMWHDEQWKQYGVLFILALKEIFSQNNLPFISPKDEELLAHPQMKYTIKTNREGIHFMQEHIFYFKLWTENPF